MKNPLENLFSKVRKKGKDALLATALTASVFNANATENPNQSVKDTEKTTTKSVQQNQERRDSTATVSYEAEQERLAQMKALEETINFHKHKLQELTGFLQETQVDFHNNYISGLHFKEGEKAKSKLVGFEKRIADLAMKMGREKVATYDITSEKAINGLCGILLSGGKNSPFEKEVTYLAQFTQGQLGPLVGTGVMLGSKGHESPDMAIHKHLGRDPRLIIETSLKIVKEQYELEKAEDALRKIIATPDGGSTVIN